MISFSALAFVILLLVAVVAIYFCTRPTRIVLTADALIIHSAYKDYVYPRLGLIYKGPVPKEIWSRGLYRTFGDGWPLPLAGKFHSPAFGDIVIVSMTKPNALYHVETQGKTLLLQLSPEQIRALQSPADERAR